MTPQSAHACRHALQPPSIAVDVFGWLKRAVFFRWCFFSGLNYLLIVALTWGFHSIVGVNERTAFAIPLAIAFVLNFFVLRYLVYDRVHGGVIKQLIRYAVSAVCFRAAEYGIYLLMLDMLGWRYLVAAALVMPASFSAKFLWYGKMVFRSRTHTHSDS